MYRRTPLYRAVEPAVVSSGLQPDLHPLLAVLWEAAANVVFFSGKVKRRYGGQLVFDAGNGDVRGLSQQRDNNGVRWVWAAAEASVKRWYGPAAELIHTFPSYQQDQTLTSEPTYVDLTHYGDWTIMNNGLDEPKIYKPGLGLAKYGDAKPCTRFMKKLSFMLAIGVGAKGTRVEFSDSSNIEVFTATTQNSAGGISLDDFDTRIAAAAVLGNNIAVYGQDQMGLVSYISAPFYFAQRTVLSTIGAVGKNAVASDGSNNFGIGRNGIWWTDGNTFKYVDEGPLHDYLQNEVNWLQAAKCVAVRNDFTGCFEFFFPMRASLDVNEGWSLDPRTGGWSPVPAVSLKDERRLFQFPLIGAHSDGKVLFDGASKEVVTPLTLRTKPLLLQLQQGSQVEDIHVASKVDEVEMLVKTAQNVEWRIGSCHEWGGEYEWSAWKELEASSKTYRIGATPPDGVYWKLDFRSVADVWDLDLQGFVLFGQVEGSKRGSA